MQTNKLAPYHDLNKLAGSCQDMWHYAKFISPQPGCGESTLTGSREYRGLLGKLYAYRQLRGYVNEWSLDSLPAFLNCELTNVHDIESAEELATQTSLALEALRIVCDANGIDGYSGEIKKTNQPKGDK